ncbi:MAG: FliH/SctL family protein [Polyangiaceae bacterium]
MATFESSRSIFGETPDAAPFVRRVPEGPRRPSWMAVPLNRAPLRGVPLAGSLQPAAVERVKRDATPPPEPPPYASDDEEALEDLEGDAGEPPLAAFEPPPTPAPPMVPQSDFDALEERVALLQRALEDATKSVERAVRDALHQAEPDLVALSVAIAERVIGRELASDRSIITGWVREGVASIYDSSGKVECVVSPEVASALEEFTDRFDHEVKPTVIVDPSLRGLACEVRNAHGRVGAGLEDRLNAVKASLASDEHDAPAQRALSTAPIKPPHR